MITPHTFTPVCIRVHVTSVSRGSFSMMVVEWQHTHLLSYKKVQVGKDQEQVQSEKDSHSKNRDGKKTKLTIKYLYHENIS